MQVNTRPKLFPPLALLWQPPLPLRDERGALSGHELRRIVADLIG